SIISTERLLGFPYDMTLLLGMLYYYDPTQFLSVYDAHNSGADPLYFRYFSHFMHYVEFANHSGMCPVDLYKTYNDMLDKELFFKADWYKEYYKDFTAFNDPGMGVLEVFKDTVTTNSTLQSHLDGIYSWGSVAPCIDDIFDQYDNFVHSHWSDIT